jgi:hypothetical protein
MLLNRCLVADISKYTRQSDENPCDLLPLQQPRQLHQLFEPCAPLVLVRHKCFAVADFVGDAGGEVFVGWPAGLAVGDPMRIFPGMKQANESLDIRRVVGF